MSPGGWSLSPGHDTNLELSEQSLIILLATPWFAIRSELAESTLSVGGDRAPLNAPLIPGQQPFQET